MPRQGIYHSLTKVNVSAMLIPLSQRASISFQVLPIALNVLHHAVFPGELIVVGEVADYPVEGSGRGGYR